MIYDPAMSRRRRVFFALALLAAHAASTASAAVPRCAAGAIAAGGTVAAGTAGPAVAADPAGVPASDGDVAVLDNAGPYGAAPDAHTAVSEDAAPRGPTPGAHTAALATCSVLVYAGPSPEVATPAVERASRSPLIDADLPTGEPPAPPYQPPRA
jgi:hypothetical protein